MPSHTISIVRPRYFQIPVMKIRIIISEQYRHRYALSSNDEEATRPTDVPLIK